MATDPAAPIADRRLRYDAALAERATGIPDADDIVVASLPLAAEIGSRAALLGTDTARYFSTLATLAAVDLTLARVVEPHLDALTILAQADGVDPAPIGASDRTTWGVYAANAPGHGLAASTDDEGATHISGSKAWCSLADTVSHALVTADDGQGGSGLYAVPLQHAGLEVDSRSWISRGLAGLRTSTVTFTDVPAVPVGGPGWYLDRPGFTWGGMAVAAVWYGGAQALADSLLQAAGRREPDQIALATIGAAEIALHQARTALEHAAETIDAGDARGLAGVTLALRTRSVVAAAAEEVTRLVGHALGPFPLTQNETHARRVADLTVYIRQHHAERDLAVLGRHVLDAGAAEPPFRTPL